MTVAILDETHDPARRSWVASANRTDTDFPIQNLPVGIFSLGDAAPRLGMAIGDSVIDIDALRQRGWLSGSAAEVADACKGNLNDVFAMGRGPLGELRRQVAALLDAQGPFASVVRAESQHVLHERDACTMHLPARVGNYTDFYAGIYHARAAGALLTPEDPLPANYLWVPIAYHGRASSVRVSGGGVRRPRGQQPPAADGVPGFGPTKRLDFELELGFWIGSGNALGEPVGVDEAADHIAGFCLLNDWSARDVQRWEMFPLGPFLSKNFSTMVSPWVVLPEALLPFRMPAMPRADGEPEPLPYLRGTCDKQHGSIDIALGVQIRTARMRSAGEAAIDLLHSNARHLYWTPAQMLAHHTVGGCNMQPGDLIGTGTISGPVDDQLGSMLELTFGGTKPVTLPNGETRGFLEDGDEITFTGTCRRDGFVSIGFGDVRGRVDA